jgi:HK97 family phage portal protein
MTDTLRVVSGPVIERAAQGGSNIISLSATEKRVASTANWDTYLQMYKTHPVVRAAIDKIAKAATSSGYKFLPRDSTKPVNQAEVDQLNLIFARSKANFVLRTIFVDLLIYGDAFLHIVKARNDAPYSFSREMPQFITLVFDTSINDISQYIVRDNQTNLEAAFPANEFVHIRIYDPYNDIFGLSLLESLKATVTQDLYAQTYNAAYFENSAQTGIVFNMRGASADEVVRNREFLKTEYSTPAKAHKPLLLEGDVTVGRSVATPAEMEYIKGREFLRDEILAVLDVPRSKIGGMSSVPNASATQKDDKAFRVETVQPIQATVEDGFSEDMIWTLFGMQDTVFAFNDVDMRDEQERMTVDVDGLTHGVFILNELRQQRGLPPVPGGDEAFIQTASGIVPVKDIATLLQQQQAQAQANAAKAHDFGGSQPNPSNAGTGAAQTAADATGQKQNARKQPAPPVPKPPQKNPPTGNQKVGQ